jgi:hypothetical protein
LARVLALVPDLMLASRVEATLGAAGHQVRTEAGAAAADLTGIDLVVLDLGDTDPSGVAGQGPPVLGFYSHTDVETRRRAEAAGVDLVVPRSRLAREMPELVERLLAGRG